MTASNVHDVGVGFSEQRGSRRAVLFSILASTLLMGSSPGSSATVEATNAADTATLASRVMSVVPTSVPGQPWGLKEVAGGETALIKSFAELDALFLGEHHNSAADHALQADIIQKLHQEAVLRGKKVEVGLEMVQKQFQPVLDRYISKATANDADADKELFDGVEWVERWAWSFEGYLPVFRTCRALGIPLVALNVDKETLSKVSAGGLDALSQDEKDAYVSDRQGFIDFIKSPGYSQYVNEVVMDSFSLHARMGLLGKTPNPQTFFATRILWDEGMSNVAWGRIKADNKVVMVVLEGADHIKYRKGSVGRLERMDPNLKVKSVMLNPSSADTSPTGTVRTALALSMSYPAKGAIMGGHLPLADFVWWSKPFSGSIVASSVPTQAQGPQ